MAGRRLSIPGGTRRHHAVGHRAILRRKHTLRRLQFETLESRRLLAARLDEPSGFGEVYSFKISRDGQYAVYAATRESASEPELFSIRLSTGDITTLNSPLVQGGHFIDFQISPDSRRVVYVADQQTEGTFELYSAAIDATGSVKLNGPLVRGGNVTQHFQISPNSRRVVYLADQDTDDVYELYSAAIDTGGSTKLNSLLVHGGDVDSKFAISPDSRRVVYLADQGKDGVDELYSAAIDATGSTKLNSPLTSGGSVRNFLVSPDGTRVVYRADQDTDEIVELYSAAIAATGSIKLNPNPAPGGVGWSDFKISPDSRHVVYRADQDTEGVFELYRAAIDATGSTKINPPLVSGGQVLHRFEISPDSSRVVYVADQDTDGVVGLYSAAIDATGSIKLNSPLVAGGNIGYFQFSPDGSRVVYRADQETDGIVELYSAAIHGTGSTKLNSPMVPGGSIAESAISGFLVTPDSRHVVYVADQDTDEMDELYVSAIDATGSTKLSAPLNSGEHVRVDFQFAADGSGVVYRSMWNHNFPRGLYVAFIEDISLRLPDGDGRDELSVRRSGAELEVRNEETGKVVARERLAKTGSLTVHGGETDADHLTVDHAPDAFFAVPGGIHFDGGSGAADELVVQGTGDTTWATFVASPSGVAVSEGGAENRIIYADVETISVLHMLGAAVDGALHVHDAHLTVESPGYLDLGTATTIVGGTLNAAGGIHLDASEVILGHGTLTGPLASERGSAITLDGDLTLGDAASFDGVDLAGRLNVGANTVILLDGHKAVLGSQTTLGDFGTADGILNAPKGVELPDTRTFVGQGYVNTDDGQFENQGYVHGIDQGNATGLTFNHLVTGSGDYGGLVTFNGGTDFGSSPGRIDVLGSAKFGAENVHRVEIGGLVPGEEFDCLVATRSVALDGTLRVVSLDLGNDYQFAMLDRFEILQFGSATGAFRAFEGMEIGEGMRFEPVQESRYLELVVIPASWQNYHNRFDVDDNHVVIPVDVLALINEINLRGSRVLPPISSQGEMPPDYWDVTGDNLLTPEDVLDVIQHINGVLARPAEGEPDPATVPLAPAMLHDRSPLHDADFARCHGPGEPPRPPAGASMTAAPSSPLPIPWLAAIDRVFAVSSQVIHGSASEPPDTSALFGQLLPDPLELKF